MPVVVLSFGQEENQENQRIIKLVKIVIIASLNTLYFIHIYRMIFHVLNDPFLSIFPSEHKKYANYIIHISSDA